VPVHVGGVLLVQMAYVTVAASLHEDRPLSRQIGVKTVIIGRLPA
jgi:hypothetical protein